MVKILLLVQAEQRANLDRLYDSIARYSDATVVRLTSRQQRNLRVFLKGIDSRRFDYTMLMLRSKKVMKQARFLRTIPNLVFLEHDAWQNYAGGKYNGRFSRLYKALPHCTVISSGFGVTQKLAEEGINCHFVPKGFDQEVLSNLGLSRDIPRAFVGSTGNEAYRRRAQFLDGLAEDGHIRVLKTASGKDYLNTLNRIRFFVSADIGFGEYMLKNFEALACGCILCAYDQGPQENKAFGFEDMKNTILYHGRDELLEKIAILEQDPALAARVRENGQKLAESRYPFQQLGKAIVEILEHGSGIMKTPVPHFPAPGGGGLVSDPVGGSIMQDRAVSDGHHFQTAKTCFGHTMTLDPSDSIGSRILRDGIYEHSTIALMRDIMGRLDVRTFLDVGANIGNHSLALSDLCTRLLAFEPGHKARALLEENIAQNGVSHARVLDYGLSDRESASTLHINTQGNLGASSLYRNKDTTTSEAVRLRVGDAVLAEFDVSDVDFIKIDVEGHEEYVVRGLENTIKKSRPLVQFEWDANSSDRQWILKPGNVAALFPDYRLYAYMRQTDRGYWGQKPFGKIRRLLTKLGSRKRRVLYPLSQTTDRYRIDNLLAVPSEKVEPLRAVIWE